MKDYIVNFYYTIHITADNEEEAEEMAISDYQEMSPSVSDCAVEVEEKKIG